MEDSIAAFVQAVRCLARFCKVEIVKVSELSGADLDFWVARALASDAHGAYSNSLGEACIINNVCVCQATG